MVEQQQEAGFDLGWALGFLFGNPGLPAGFWAEGVVMKAKEHRLNFGKYRGQTLEEVYLEDKSYLEWLQESMEEEDEKEGREVPNPWIATISQCFKEMAKVRIY